MAKIDKLTVPLNLEITRDSYSKLAAAKNTSGNETMTGYALGAMCGQMLEAYANGGLIIRQDSIKQVEQACGENVVIGSEMQLVSAVQNATKRDSGANVFTVKVDDAIYPAVAEYAQTVGMTPQEVMDDMGNRMVRDSLSFYTNGMNYEPVVYMTEAQGRRLEKLTGKKHMTGEDILKLIDAKELVGA